MKTVNVHAAKTHLSRLIEEVESGRDVIIAKAGRPVARLTRIDEGRQRTGFGTLKGKIRMDENFDAPLPEALLRKFGAVR